MSFDLRFGAMLLRNAGLVIWSSCLAILLALTFLADGSFSPVYSQSSHAGTTHNQVVVLGTAKIVDDNVASARQTAISSAIAKGVEFYLVNFLGEESVSDYLDRLVETILPNANELIQDYQVAKEAQIGQRYGVVMRLRINEQLVNNKLQELGLLAAEAKPIRVLFLVGSTLRGSLQYWWANPAEMPPLTSTELVLFRAFQDKGYDIINRTISLPSQEITLEMRQPQLGRDLVKKWGEVFGADAVIYGRSGMNEAGEITISLSVVGVDNGQEYCRLTRAGQAGPGTNMDMIVAGLEGIVQDLMPKLESCLEEAGGAKRVQVKKFEVTLKGLQSYAQYKKLREFISNEIPGVQNFIQSRIGSHLVSFRITFEGNEDKFANLVMYHEGLPVPIKGVEKSEGKVTFIIGSSSLQQNHNKGVNKQRNDHTKSHNQLEDHPSTNFHNISTQ